MAIEFENIRSPNGPGLGVLNKLNLESIFENTTDSVWAINMDYEILYVNKVFATAFYSNFRVLLEPGINLLLALPDPLREIWKPRYDRALNKESFSFIDHVVAENVSLYIELFMNPIIIEEEVVGAMFFGKDITTRIQDEKALKESQLLLKSSLESQKDTILFSINKEYEYLYFNKAHADVMKYAYGKNITVGMNVLDCITVEEDRNAAKENYDRALHGESHSNIRKYGGDNTAYYESFFNPVRDDKNEIIGATGLARDISERIKSETALIESERKLKDLNATKDKLFSIIGHDLRSPFSNIITLSEVLLENLTNASFTDSEKYLKLINHSANDTLVLLDNLLHWARAQTDMLQIKPEKIMLSDTIHEVIAQKKSIAGAKDIDIAYLPKEAIEVYADQNILQTVFRNLISNAIKFTNPGGKIRITAQKKEGSVEITTSDNGIGMSEQRMKNLFKLSANNSRIGTANEQGFGLGLMLCKELIEKHHGKIWVESTEGKGSDFKFTLPIKPQ